MKTKYFSQINKQINHPWVFCVWINYINGILSQQPGWRSSNHVTWDHHHYTSSAEFGDRDWFREPWWGGRWTRWTVTCLISVHLPGGGRGEDRPDQPDPNKQHRSFAWNVSRSTEKCEIDCQCQSLQVMYILTAMALLKKAVVYNTLKCIGLTNAIHIYFNSFLSFSANAV